MEEIKWSEKHSVGNKQFDAQHIKLLEIYNELIDPDKMKTKERISSQTIKDLLNFVREHFDDEERFMKKINYPKINSHIKKHREFHAEVLEFYNDFMFSEESLRERIAKYLKNYIEEHLFKDDMDYAIYNKENPKS